MRSCCILTCRILIVSRYNRKDPATFLPGDIVEVQASFACFTSRNGQNTLGIVMRGLTLLDDSFSKVRTAFILSVSIKMLTVLGGENRKDENGNQETHV